MRQPKFIIQQYGERWGYRLVGSNGITIMESNKLFVSKHNAIESAVNAANKAYCATIEVLVN